MTKLALKNREKATSQLIVRKKLHKIGKHWVAIGMGTLVCAAGAYMLPNTVQANTVNNKCGIALNNSVYSADNKNIMQSGAAKTGIYKYRAQNVKLSQHTSQPENIMKQAKAIHTGIVGANLNKQAMSRKSVPNAVNNSSSNVNSNNGSPQKEIVHPPIVGGFDVGSIASYNPGQPILPGHYYYYPGGGKTSLTPAEDAQVNAWYLRSPINNNSAGYTDNDFSPSGSSFWMYDQPDGNKLESDRTNDDIYTNTNNRIYLSDGGSWWGAAADGSSQSAPPMGHHDTVCPTVWYKLYASTTFYSARFQVSDPSDSSKDSGPYYDMTSNPDSDPNAWEHNSSNIPIPAGATVTNWPSASLTENTPGNEATATGPMYTIEISSKQSANINFISDDGEGSEIPNSSYSDKGTPNSSDTNPLNVPAHYHVDTSKVPTIYFNNQSYNIPVIRNTTNATINYTVNGTPYPSDSRTLSDGPSDSDVPSSKYSDMMSNPPKHYSVAGNISSQPVYNGGTYSIPITRNQGNITLKFIDESDKSNIIDGPSVPQGPSDSDVPKEDYNNATIPAHYKLDGSSISDVIYPSGGSAGSKVMYPNKSQNTTYYIPIIHKINKITYAFDDTHGNPIPQLNNYVTANGPSDTNGGNTESDAVSWLKSKGYKPSDLPNKSSIIYGQGPYHIKVRADNKFEFQFNGQTLPVDSFNKSDIINTTITPEDIASDVHNLPKWFVLANPSQTYNIDYNQSAVHKIPLKLNPSVIAAQPIHYVDSYSDFKGTNPLYSGTISSDELAELVGKMNINVLASNIYGKTVSADQHIKNDLNNHLLPKGYALDTNNGDLDNQSQFTIIAKGKSVPTHIVHVIGKQLTAPVTVRLVRKMQRTGQILGSDTVKVPVPTDKWRVGDSNIVTPQQFTSLPSLDGYSIDSADNMVTETVTPGTQPSQPNITYYYDANFEPVKVKFINQNGQDVNNNGGSDTVNDILTTKHTMEDFGNQDKNNLKPGYTIDTGNDNQGTYTVQLHNPNVQIVHVTGEKLQPITVKAIYQVTGKPDDIKQFTNIPGNPSTASAEGNNWRVGDSDTINPNNPVFQRTGYALKTDQNSVKIVATPNGTNPGSVTFYYKSVPEAVRVHFINQNGTHLTGQGDTINGSAFQHVPLYQNGKVVNITLPKGYHYDTKHQGNPTAYDFNLNHTQNVNVYVEGDKSKPVIVKAVYQIPGRPDSDKKLVDVSNHPSTFSGTNSNWRVGDSDLFDPNSQLFHRTGYLLENKQSAVRTVATPNGNSVPVITFYYRAVPETAKVHFINQNNKHLVGESSILKGDAFQTVPFYQNGKVVNITIPKGYHYDGNYKGNPSVYEFSLDKNQNINVYVAGDKETQHLQYLDQIGNVVGSDNMSGQVGNTFDMAADLPKGYRYDYTENSGFRNMQFQPNTPKVYYVRVDGLDNLSQLKAKVVRDNMPTVEIPVGFVDEQNGSIAYANPNIMRTPGYVFDQKDSKGLTDGQLKANVQPNSVSWLNGEPVLYYHAVPQELNINYINQNGQQVGNTTLHGNTNQQVALYDDNGVHHLDNIPNNYHYVPSDAYNIVKFAPNASAINVRIQSAPVHSKVTVYLEKDKYSGGHKTDQQNKQIQVPVNGYAGDSIVVNPATYVPTGYHTDDQPVIEQLIPDGDGVDQPKVYFRYVSDNGMPFSYDDNDINQLNIGQSKYLNGNKITRIANSYGYFRPVRDIWLYSGLPFNMRNRKVQITPQMHLTMPVARTFQISKGNDKQLVYELLSKTGSYFVVGGHHYTENAYYQKDELVGHKIKLLKPVQVHSNKQPDASNVVKTLPVGDVLDVNDVAYLLDPIDKRTEVYLGNNQWITANKNYIKLV